MLADSLSGKVSLPGLQTAILSLCSHGRVSELCGISSYKNMNPVRSGHYSDDLMQLSYFHKMLSLKVKVSQLCLILCSLSGSSVHGILQARILEWVAVYCSRGSSKSRDRTQVSCIAGELFIV